MIMRALTISLATLACAFAVQAQPATTASGSNQVVVPDVERRDVKVPRIPSNDFELGLLAGTYSTQNFGASALVGLRAGYHITEDFFVESVYARTKISDEDFRRVLPGGVFREEKQSLAYYNLSLGWNVLPGEVFVGSRRAKASALYLIGGIGSTKLAEQRRQTYNFGFGLRVFMADWAALQLDVRDHIFKLDLLGERKTTQNLELTAGLTFFF